METEALLLTRANYGENTLRLSFLCPKSGFTTAFKKTGKLLSANAQPDLFDTASILLETGRQGNGHFVKSYAPRLRRENIPKDYARFQTACQLALVLCRNGPFLEDALQTYRLTETALDAFNTPSTPPPVIYLKFLYLLVRQEGYPVRQAWRQTLTSRQAQALALILSQPLEVLAGHTPRLCDELILNLEAWTRSETSLQLSA
tara:strand:- start:33 stop:641 length:609 start_codon:yes stop_codon:yes gene_type:complete